MDAPISIRCMLTPLFAIVMLFGMTGCGQPTEDARQNRRLADALLTAVTVKNVKELDKNKALIDKRRTDAVMSEANHKLLTEIYAVAKAGKWSEAEDALYTFRESVPFPK